MKWNIFYVLLFSLSLSFSSLVLFSSIKKSIIYHNISAYNFLFKEGELAKNREKKRERKPFPHTILLFFTTPMQRHHDDCLEVS